MTELQALFARFEASRVLVVGEAIVDVYTQAEAIGVAAEDPTPVARRLGESWTLGGAAFVCRNLVALGAQVDFVTLTGEGDEAARVATLAGERLTLSAVAEAGRPTTVKQRIFVDGGKVLQLDTREDAPIAEATAARVAREVEARLAGADAVILSDYRHGLFRPDLAARLVAAAQAAGKTVFVDSQVAQTAGGHAHFAGADVFVLNLREARALDPAFTPAPRADAFAVLQAALRPRAIVVKLGDAGAMLFDGGRVWQAPARPAEVADVTGAGDAFLAALVLTGLDAPYEALEIANGWASLSVELQGTQTPERGRLAEALGGGSKRRAGRPRS